MWVGSVSPKKLTDNLQQQRDEPKNIKKTSVHNIVWFTNYLLVFNSERLFDIRYETTHRKPYILSYPEEEVPIRTRYLHPTRLQMETQHEKTVDNLKTLQYWLWSIYTVILLKRHNETEMTSELVYLHKKHQLVHLSLWRRYVHTSLSLWFRIIKYFFHM